MKRTFLALAVSLTAAANLRAHMPPFTTDDNLVGRSDAIVIGHVEAGFTVHDTVPKEYSAIGIHVTSNRTVLIVTKVIKGQLPLGPTPVIIHDGLKPVILDAKTPGQETMGELCPPADEKTGPQVPVGLFYPSTVIGMPPTADIRKDQIWFLRKASLNPNVTEDTSALGVRWQQDVQPLDREGYYRAILTGDPTALKPFTAGNSWQAREARVVQDRLRIQRVGTISDPELRADALVTVIGEEAPFNSAGQLAMEKLTALGPTGLKKLVPLFQNAGHDYDRRAILQAWRDYKPALPVLIAWLRAENQWWAKQSPKDMIWSFQEGQKGGTDFDDPRAASNRNVYCAVEALGNQGGDEGKAVIEQTRAQWTALGVRAQPGNDIVEVCDEALGATH